jgi:hypothetical protein
MKSFSKKAVLLAAIILQVAIAFAQFPLGEVLFLSNSDLKEGADADNFAGYVNDVSASWSKTFPGSTIAVMKSDRGDQKGESILVCTVAKTDELNKLSSGSPFAKSQLSGLSDYLTSPAAFTEYHLIAPGTIKSLPTLGILGIHYIKVKKDKSAAFEKFVNDKLHPAVGHVMPDMQLLYYKAVAGEHKGTYITVFAITSYEARERMWPTGGAEQDVVKTSFSPHKELGKELATTYFVEDSYLGPESGGGAAYWESREWTDYLYDLK